MKHLYAILILSFTINSVAQNNYINYKAIVKDSIGFILSDETVDVEFTIAYEYLNGVTAEVDTATVYKELHTTTTDNSGIIVLNIGEGTPVIGDFNEINWSTIHNAMLNTKFDVGTGMIDLGYSKFNTVPYAMRAESATFRTKDNVTSNLPGSMNDDDFVFGDYELDTNAGNVKKFFFDKSEGAFRAGWIGGDNWNSENLGTGSFATGLSTKASSTGSIAMGNRTIASGYTSMAIGNETIASGFASVAMNSFTHADGAYTTAFGRQTDADAYASVAMGRYNVGGGSPSQWLSSEPVFEIGIGSGISNRENALTVLKNGKVGIGFTNPSKTLQVNGQIGVGSVEYLEDFGTNEIGFRGDLVPVQNNLYDLGTSINRWDDVYATNGTIQTSDIRDKTNIRQLEYGLNEIMKLKPISFNWKERVMSKKKLGFSAQDLLAIVPEVVKTSDWKMIEENNGKLKQVELDRLGVYYSDLIPVLVKAIQEQQEMINKLIEHNKSESLKQKRLVTN